MPCQASMQNSLGYSVTLVALRSTWMYLGSRNLESSRVNLQTLCVLQILSQQAVNMCMIVA